MYLSATTSLRKCHMVYQIVYDVQNDVQNFGFFPDENCYEMRPLRWTHSLCHSFAARVQNPWHLSKPITLLVRD